MKFHIGTIEIDDINEYPEGHITAERFVGALEALKDLKLLPESARYERTGDFYCQINLAQKPGTNIYDIFLSEPYIPPKQQAPKRNTKSAAGMGTPTDKMVEEKKIELEDEEIDLKSIPF